MKINKFNKLKEEFEIFSFEKNFNPLSTTLYYFSFLGNIFLILFSYFFIKDVTNSIPSLFKGQDLFFSIFIILFMTGYELFKRFAFEQLVISFIKAGKATLNNILASVLCLGLVVGSFYLSLNGSHRLIDTSAVVETKLDSVTNNKADSIAKYYDNEITYYRGQSARTRSERVYRDSIVNVLQTVKDTKIKETEQKVGTKLQSQTFKIEENSTAFAVMVFFLEFIILLGVSFASFYKYTSYTEMKTLLTTPKFKQINLHLQLLKLFYQNGRKKEGDPIVAKSKFISLVSAAKLGCTQKEISDFVNICSELEIVVGDRRKKTYNMGYDKAYEIIENKD
jgi:hypothetical protein